MLLPWLLVSVLITVPGALREHRHPAPEGSVDAWAAGYWQDHDGPSLRSCHERHFPEAGRHVVWLFLLSLTAGVCDLCETLSRTPAGANVHRRWCEDRP